MNIIFYYAAKYLVVIIKIIIVRIALKRVVYIMDML
jgi:hypothetical protein